MQQIGCFLLLVFFAVILLISFAQTFPLAFKVSLGIAIAIIAGVVAYKNNREEKEAAERERLRKEAETERMKAEYEATQRQFRTTLETCVVESKATIVDIQRLISESSRALEQADQEFSAGAFAPFWDAVEHAANLLAQSNSGVNQINQRAKLYGDTVIKLDSEPPTFNVALDTLPDTTRVADRMRAIVRKAQKDFQFATIYELRKTNKLLISGFTNLAEALTQMSDRLESSLDSLSESIMNIAETDCANTEELIAGIQRLDERATSDCEARRQHERKQIDMLDNIQRKRKPRRVFPKTFD